MNTGKHGESDGYSAVDEGQIIEAANDGAKKSTPWYYYLGGTVLGLLVLGD